MLSKLALKKILRKHDKYGTKSISTKWMEKIRSESFSAHDSFEKIVAQTQVALLYFIFYYFLLGGGKKRKRVKKTKIKKRKKRARKEQALFSSCLGLTICSSI